MSQSLPMSPGIGYPADGPVELQRKIVWNTKYIADILAGAPPGPGDVVGPASSTNNAVALFDGTTGKLLKNSNLVYSGTTLTVPDAFAISSAGSISLTAGGTNKNLVLTPSGTGYTNFLKSGLSTASAAWTPSELAVAIWGEGSSGGKADVFQGYASATAGTRPVFGFRRSKGTLAIPTTVAQSDTIGSILWGAYDGTNFINSAEFVSKVDTMLAVSTGVVGQRLSFSIGLTGTGSRTECLTIRSNGRVDFGFADRSIPAWTTNGALMYTGTPILTDTTSSGTVAAMGINSIGAPTVAASSATTYTNSANLYVAGAPSSGTNVTQSNPWAIWVDAGACRFDASVTVCGDVATPAGGSTSARLLFGTTAGFGIYYGSGAPSSLTAAQGSIYMRSDGGSTTRMYINNSSSSGTTWTAVNTVA